VSVFLASNQAQLKWLSAKKDDQSGRDKSLKHPSLSESLAMHDLQLGIVVIFQPLLPIFDYPTAGLEYQRHMHNRRLTDSTTGT
jgi:hypothetical protein